MHWTASSCASAPCHWLCWFCWPHQPAEPSHQQHCWVSDTWGFCRSPGSLLWRADSHCGEREKTIDLLCAPQRKRETSQGNWLANQLIYWAANWLNLTFINLLYLRTCWGTEPFYLWRSHWPPASPHKPPSSPLWTGSCISYTENKTFTAHETFERWTSTTKPSPEGTKPSSSGWRTGQTDVFIFFMLNDIRENLIPCCWDDKKGVKIVEMCPKT